ncbi:hypothetical protein DPSP01_010444 [Paraphaeosphaeria sporulosa]
MLEVRHEVRVPGVRWQETPVQDIWKRAGCIVVDRHPHITGSRGRTLHAYQRSPPHTDFHRDPVQTTRPRREAPRRPPPALVINSAAARRPRSNPRPTSSTRFTLDQRRLQCAACSKTTLCAL